jgi:hypothetical protein
MGCAIVPWLKLFEPASSLQMLIQRLICLGLSVGSADGALGHHFGAKRHVMPIN